MSVNLIRKSLSSIIALVLVLTTMPVGSVQAYPILPSGFTTELVVPNLTGPTTMAFAADGRIFIGQKDGRVRVFQNGALLPTDFINLSSEVNNYWDRGMLGIAVHPDFPNTPYVYLLYVYDPPGTTDNGDGARVSRLLRVTADPSNTNVALPGSGVVLLGTNGTLANIGDPASNDGPPSCQNGALFVQDCIAADSPSHSIGTLVFGTDGSLFASSGDGAHFNYADPRALRALNADSLNGKILRINPLSGEGYVDNPFYNGNLNSNRSKVYGLGLRNPFRVAINPSTNEPFIGDVGWNSWEEINTGRGRNFGWPCYEGNDVGSAVQGSYAGSTDTSATCNALYAQGPGAVQAPLYAYPNLGGSVQAGAFYQGSTYPGQYQGALFIADYNYDWIKYLTFGAGGAVTVNDFGTDVSPVGGIVQLLAGPDTNLYYVAYNGPTPNTSEIRRIRYTSGGNTPPTANASASPTAGVVPLDVSFSSTGSFDPDAQSLAYDWNFGDGNTSTEANPVHTYLAGGDFTVTLTVTDPLGATGSDTVTITVGNSPPVATISAPSNGLHYNTGDTINFSGTGLDDEEGSLSGANLQWDILLHHGSHVHFDFIPGLSGNSGSFVVPDHGDDTWLELCLTATDSGGLNDQKCVDLLPNTVTLTFQTIPTGLQLEYDGVSYTAPFSVITNVGSKRDFIAAVTQDCHSFTSWSDGGAASHQVTIPATAQTYTATYALCPAEYNPLSLWTTDFSYFPQGWRADLHPRVMGDVNGDGKDDIVGFGYGGVLVGLSNGTGFDPVTRWTEDFSYNQGWRMDTYPRMVGDVNGDGKADIVGFGYAGAVVALSNGTSFDALSLWTTDFSYFPQGWRADLHPRVMGDVNGDGKDDIVGFGYGGVLVALSNGSSFDPATRWTEDFSYNQGWRMDTYPRMVGDVNGDGKDDIVGFGYAGAVVALSNGSSFDALSLWTTDFSYYPQGWRADLHPRVTGDANGDGRDDIFGFGYGGVLVGLSNGVGIGLVSNVTTDFSYNQGWRMDTYPRMVGDVNGDGKADIIGFGYAGAVVATAR